jgi:predicted kinase
MKPIRKPKERLMKYPEIDDREIDLTDGESLVEGRKILIMTYGLPRSGKSTWARKQGVPVVEPDAIRLAKTGKRWHGPIEHEVWATARTMVRALFLAGHNVVILDSTCGTRKQRDFFNPSSDVPWTRYVKNVPTDSQTCKDRALAGPYPELEEVIAFMGANWEDIQPEEGVATWQNIWKLS